MKVGEYHQCIQELRIVRMDTRNTPAIFQIYLLLSEIVGWGLILAYGQSQHKEMKCMRTGSGFLSICCNVPMGIFFIDTAVDGTSKESKITWVVERDKPKTYEYRVEKYYKQFLENPYHSGSAIEPVDLDVFSIEGFVLLSEFLEKYGRKLEGSIVEKVLPTIMSDVMYLRQVLSVIAMDCIAGNTAGVIWYEADLTDREFVLTISYQSPEEAERAESRRAIRLLSKMGMCAGHALTIKKTSGAMEVKLSISL